MAYIIESVLPYILSWFVSSGRRENTIWWFQYGIHSVFQMWYILWFQSRIWAYSLIKQNLISTYHVSGPDVYRTLGLVPTSVNLSCFPGRPLQYSKKVAMMVVCIATSEKTFLGESRTLYRGEISRQVLRDSWTKDRGGKKDSVRVWQTDDSLLRHCAGVTMPHGVSIPGPQHRLGKSLRFLKNLVEESL